MHISTRSAPPIISKSLAVNHSWHKASAINREDNPMSMLTSGLAVPDANDSPSSEMPTREGCAPVRFLAFIHSAVHSNVDSVLYAIFRWVCLSTRRSSGSCLVDVQPMIKHSLVHLRNAARSLLYDLCLLLTTQHETAESKCDSGGRCPWSGRPGENKSMLRLGARSPWLAPCWEVVHCPGD